MCHLVVGRGLSRRAPSNSAVARGLDTRPQAGNGGRPWFGAGMWSPVALWLEVWRSVWQAARLVISHRLGGPGLPASSSCRESSKAFCPFVDVSVGFVCQNLGPFDGGDLDLLVLCLLASPPENEVSDGLVQALPRGAEVPDGVDHEGGPLLLQAVPAEGGVWGSALEGFCGAAWGRRWCPV